MVHSIGISFPCNDRNISRFWLSNQIISAKIRALLKSVETLFSTRILSQVLHADGVLCILKTSCVSTKSLLELASNNSIDAEEEMGSLEIGYARVSSREQAEDTNALEQQIDRLKSAGATHILYDVEKGKRDGRKQFQELMRLVKAGRVRTLFITRIDRITRSLPTLRKLVQDLQSYNVNLVVLDQKLDLSSPQGKLMLNVLGTLAEWEVDLLAERVKRGLEHIQKQGWAHGSCPFGYVVLNHKYVLDQTPFLCLLSERPEHYLEFYSDSVSEVDTNTISHHKTVAEIARDCIEVFLDHRGIRLTLKTIFQKYGIQKTKAKCNAADRIFHWTIRGFGTWIRNPVLEGHTCYNKQEQQADGKRRNKPRDQWTFHYNTHPDQRLLQEGEAEEIERILQANCQTRAGTFDVHSGEHRPYAYQIGLIYCDKCRSRGIRKSVYTSAHRYGYYGCRHAGIGCDNHKNIKQTVIEQSLIEAIVQKSQQLNQDQVTPIPNAPFKTKRLQELEEQLKFFQEFPGFNPEAESCKANIQQQIEQEGNFLRSQELEDRTVEDIIQHGSCLGIWHALSGKEKFQIYQRIVDRIFFYNGQVVSVVFKGNSGLALLQEDNYVQCN